ncbi:reverse transcriptase domain-containing protein [Tanacetum coccineum]
MMFTCPYGTFAYRRMPFGLCNALATFQRCMTTIFHDLLEDFMEVFMDYFLVFGNSFDNCLVNLEKMLARCEDTNLVLNWKKCYFMVREGIVLGHKIYRSGIEVDKAKIDVIAKLPYPTNVKGVRSFLGHAGFTVDDCKKAFNILKEKLTTAPIIISPDWNFPFELMCDASDFAVGAVPSLITVNHAGSEILEILAHCHSGPTGGHHSASITRSKVYESGFFWPGIFKDA